SAGTGTGPPVRETAARVARQPSSRRGIAAVLARPRWAGFTVHRSMVDLQAVVLPPLDGRNRRHRWPGARRGSAAVLRYRALAPPLRFAFFSRLSYWCDIRCAWIWAMKSITTTTTISSEVPPK